MSSLPQAPNRPAAEWEKSRPLHIAGLAECRLQIMRRRAHAMCSGAEFLCGLRVVPTTLPIYSLLVATGNRFLFPGLTPTEKDVRDYLWFHSPHYVDSTHPGWAARKERALLPFSRQIQPPWQKLLGRKITMEWLAAVIVTCAQEISAHYESTFADATRGAGKNAPVASLEAQFIVTFASVFHWTSEQTRAVPLRQLFQLDRALAASRGVEVREPAEDALLAAHLLRRQAEIDAAKAAETSSPPVTSHTSPSS